MKPVAIVLTRSDCLGCRDVALNLKAQGYDVTELDTADGPGHKLLLNIMAGMCEAGIPLDIEFPVVVKIGVTEMSMLPTVHQSDHDEPEPPAGGV